MPVSPRDFELYSRMTGTPMPSDPMSRMQMAPAVYDFTKNFAKKPNLLEKTGNLVKTVGKIGLMGLGQGFKQSQANEQRAIQEQLRTQAEARQAEALVTGDSNVERQKTPAEIIEDKRMARLERTSELKQQERDDKQEKAMDMLKAKKENLVGTPIKGSYTRTKMIKTDPPQYEEEVIDPFAQQATTADNYQQDFVPNQTSSGLIDRKMEQGSQIADETPNVAEVLSESQDSRQSEFADPEDVQKQMESDMIGGGLGKNQLSKFLKQKGLDQALLGAVGGRTTQEALIGDNSPLLDHPDVIGGEDDANLPSGMNTGSTVNLNPQREELRNTLRRGLGTVSPEKQEKILDEMMSPGDKQVNLLEQREIDNQKAIDSGFMNLDAEGRKKESIRLGSTGGIPNKTDMAEIRKDPEYIAAQESMKPKSVTSKVDEFTNKFMPAKPSSFVESMSLETSPDKAPAATFNLYQKDGSTKPFTFGISSPMAVSLNEMAKDESLQEESFGQIMNLLKKSAKDGTGMGFSVGQ